MKIFSLIIEHWPLLMLACILFGGVLSFLVPTVGKILWKPIAGLVAVLLVYQIGRRDEKAALKKKQEMTDARRKKAYAEIDSRLPSRDDLVERLRDNGF